MNTREMARRQELCQTLNMNFDEANELFSTETLSSMTMAKVNGGAFWSTLLAFLGNPALGTTAAIISIGTTIISLCADDDKPDKPTPSGGGFTVRPEDGLLLYNGAIVDSVKIQKTTNGTYNQIWTRPDTTTPYLSN